MVRNFNPLLAPTDSQTPSGRSVFSSLVRQSDTLRKIVRHPQEGLCSLWSDSQTPSGRSVFSSLVRQSDTLRKVCVLLSGQTVRHPQEDSQTPSGRSVFSSLVR
ncbi:hypothetical protein RRG08_017189 [Elysia crispata]|uniref:Uncharacterized protein n=1 Tax=Elysia crispata TaxID=231223 RepID=A0AAE1B2P4_9GAST|nr:hypothetical protein RRG08_017189 [Elysia crispata]